MSGDGRRPRRVAETLRAKLADVMRREFGDPMLATLVITDVDMPADLTAAKVSVRLLDGDEDLRRREAVVSALARAAPRLRRLVAPRLRLRRAPELRFVYDTGHDASRRVEELLAEIAAEPHSRDEEE
jgi:ribosome-binding factor A